MAEKSLRAKAVSVLRLRVRAVGACCRRLGDGQRVGKTRQIDAKRGSSVYNGDRSGTQNRNPR